MNFDQSIAALQSSPAASGVFLDFDGTLAPIVSDPAASEIVPGASDVLAELAARFALVALISGRGARDLRERVGVDGLRYFGLYGAEEMTEGGLEQSHLATRWRQSARKLAADASELISKQSLIGCEVEYKDLAVAVHYRKTQGPQPPPSLWEWAVSAAAKEDFRAGIGRKVVELRPLAESKASTLERLAVRWQIRNALVAGDDSADVEMMNRAAEILPGVVLRVGIRSAEEPLGMDRVDFQVGAPAELVEVLTRLL